MTLKVEIKEIVSNLSEVEKKELFIYLKNNINFKVKKPKVLSDYLAIIAKNKQKMVNEFHVKEIGIFGSFVTGENKRTSDIDILVEFDENGETFNNYMDLKFYCEKILKKKRVDLVIKESIRKELKSLILKEVVYV